MSYLSTTQNRQRWRTHLCFGGEADLQAVAARLLVCTSCVQVRIGLLEGAAAAVAVGAIVMRTTLVPAISLK